MSDNAPWAPLRIGDLIRESRIKGSTGQEAKKLTVRLYGRGIVASTDRGGSAATNYFRRRAGQFIYSKLDCLNGAFGIVPSNLDGYETTQDLPAFDFIGEVDPTWFLKSVSRPSFYGRFKFAAIGSRKANRVPTGEFLATRLSVPSLAEQSAISDVLMAIEEAIAQTEVLIGAIGAVKAAVIENFLLDGLAEDDHGRRLRCKSGKWKVLRLRDLATVRTGVSKNENRTYTFPIDVAYLRVANVQDGYLDLGEVKTIRIDRSQMERYRLHVGDVLFNEGGDFDKLGRGCVWSGEVDPCVHQNHVFAVRCGPKLDPRFLALFAASRRGKAYFRLSSKQTTNLASINTNDLRSFPVPVPPLSQQHQIAEIANCFNLRILNEKRMSEQLINMRIALSQELLSGRIRLPEAVISRHRDKPGKVA